MNKKDMVDLIASCLGAGRMVRTYFRYDEDSWYYYYPTAVNERFLVGQEEDDFQLDGYHIRKISDLVKAEIRSDLCEQINIWNGVVNGIKGLDMDISSWPSVFRSAVLQDKLIIVEDDLNGVYRLGKIKKACARYVLLEDIDADGVIQEEPYRFPYSKITHVAWDTRYADNWYRYMKCHRNT